LAKYPLHHYVVIDIELIDKILLFMAEVYGGCFCLSMDIFHSFYIKKQGMAMRLEEGGGAAAALLRNQLTFWSSHLARWHFEHNPTRLLLQAFFDEALCMNLTHWTIRLSYLGTDSSKPQTTTNLR
jgi:hypothetical protein